MAKIRKIFIGDTFVNTEDKLIRVTAVNPQSGDVTLSSPSWTKLWTYSHRKVLDTINCGAYKNYQTSIPQIYHIFISNQNIPEFNIDLDELCVRLVKKLDDDSRPLIGRYLAVSYGKTSVYHSGTKFLNSQEVTIDKFISIYNTISFNTNTNVNKERKSNNEINSCGENFRELSTTNYKETVNNSRSFEKVREGFGISLKIGKVRLEKGNSGSEISIKTEQKCSGVPQIQYRLFDREVCGIKGRYQRG